MSDEDRIRFPRCGMRAARKEFPGKHVVQMRIIMPDGAWMAIDGPVEQADVKKLVALAMGKKKEEKE